MNPLNQIQQTIAGFKNQTDLARQKLLNYLNNVPIAKLYRRDYQGVANDLNTELSNPMNIVGNIVPGDEQIVQLGTHILDKLAQKDASGIGTALYDLAKMTGNDKFKTLRTKGAVKNAVVNLITSPEYKKAFEAVKNPLFKISKLK